MYFGFTMQIQERSSLLNGVAVVDNLATGYLAPDLALIRGLSGPRFDADYPTHYNGLPIAVPSGGR